MELVLGGEGRYLRVAHRHGHEGDCGHKEGCEGQRNDVAKMVVCPTFHSDLPLLGWGWVDAWVSKE